MRLTALSFVSADIGINGPCSVDDVLASDDMDTVVSAFDLKFNLINVFLLPRFLLMDDLIRGSSQDASSL